MKKYLLGACVLSLLLILTSAFMLLVGQQSTGTCDTLASINEFGSEPESQKSYTMFFPVR